MFASDDLQMHLERIHEYRMDKWSGLHNEVASWIPFFWGLCTIHWCRNRKPLCLHKSVVFYVFCSAVRAGGIDNLLYYFIVAAFLYLVAITNLTLPASELKVITELDGVTHDTVVLCFYNLQQFGDAARKVVDDAGHYTIIVYGKEFSQNRCGVLTEEASLTPKCPRNSMQVVGKAKRDDMELQAFVEKLKEGEYNVYNVYDRNCIDFANELVQFLCETRIPEYPLTVIFSFGSLFFRISLVLQVCSAIFVWPLLTPQGEVKKANVYAEMVFHVVMLLWMYFYYRLFFRSLIRPAQKPIFGFIFPKNYKLSRYIDPLIAVLSGILQDLLLLWIAVYGHIYLVPN